MNLAARLVGFGEPGSIHLSDTARLQLSDTCRLEARGPVPIKGKGEVDVYRCLGLDGRQLASAQLAASTHVP